MPSCDMCGKDGANAIAKIEGVDLTVCQNCAKYGKVLRAIRPNIPKSKPGNAHYQKQEAGEPVELIVEDFAQRIRQKREELKLTQQEFARKISERESVVHHIENGTQRPSLELAEKLQRILHIILIEKSKEDVVQKTVKKADAFTLGDFMRVKK